MLICGVWGVEPRGCPTLFAFAYSNFPAIATVPPLRSFPLSSEATPYRLSCTVFWGSVLSCNHFTSFIFGLTLHP